MEFDKEKMNQTREVLLSVVNGVNPLNGKEIKKDSLLQEDKILEAVTYAASLIEDLQNNSYSRYKPLAFTMDEDQKSKVSFRPGTIGVMEFSKSVNEHLDQSNSRKLSGVDLNRRLKKMGIISEEQLNNGKKRAATNDCSQQYGFCMEKRDFRGTEYEMVVMDDYGKKYLMENIDTIMALEV